MALFLSTYTNKIDKKGRISVPAPFRSVLGSQHFAGIVVYPSFVSPCIEAAGMDHIERVSEQIAELDPYSDERIAFETAILAGGVQLAFDGEGRVTLPPAMLEEIGVDGQAIFVGKGKTFEIWNPDTFAGHAKEAREMALAKRHSLKAAPRAVSAGGGQGV